MAAEPESRWRARTTALSLLLSLLLSAVSLAASPALFAQGAPPSGPPGAPPPQDQRPCSTRDQLAQHAVEIQDLRMRLDSLVGQLDQVHQAVSDDQDNMLANQKLNTPKARAAAPKLKLALDRDSDQYFNLMSQFKDATQRLQDLMLDVPCPQ